jgi:hypothetical protein
MPVKTSKSGGLAPHEGAAGATEAGVVEFHRRHEEGRDRIDDGRDRRRGEAHCPLFELLLGLGKLLRL